MPTLRLEDIATLATETLVRCGTARGPAHLVADEIADAEATGARNLGLGFLPSYCAQLKTGKIDGQAEPRKLESPRPAVVRIDARTGFVHAAFRAGAADAIDRARRHGLAALSLTNASACGALGYFAERMAMEGLIALSYANGPRNIAAWGGRMPLLGTNPTAFATPRQGGSPIVVDLAASVVPKVAILARGRNGEALDPGWALDAEGRPTTDPAMAAAGSMLPVGGHKGAALALVVEVLAAGLSGANWSKDAAFYGTPDGGPPRVGQLHVLIDPAGFDPAFPERLETLVAALLSDPGARLPGDRRHAARAAARQNGVDVDETLLRTIEAL